MKKILSALIAASAVAGLATSASASLPPTLTTGTPPTVSGTSVFTGNSAPVCELNVIDGSLANATGLVTSLSNTASGQGQILTRCNTASAKLVVELDNHVAYTDDPLAVNGGQGTGLVREFALSTGTLAYASGYAANFTTLAATPITFNAVNHANDINASSIKVDAKVSAPSGQNLAAGIYTVRVKATLTP
jgi:hypothetical protein